MSSWTLKTCRLAPTVTVVVASILTARRLPLILAMHLCCAIVNVGSRRPSGDVTRGFGIGLTLTVPRSEISDMAQPNVKNCT